MLPNMVEPGIQHHIKYECNYDAQVTIVDLQTSREVKVQSHTCKEESKIFTHVVTFTPPTGCMMVDYFLPIGRLQVIKSVEENSTCLPCPN